MRGWTTGGSTARTNYKLTGHRKQNRTQCTQGKDYQNKTGNRWTKHKRPGETNTETKQTRYTEHREGTETRLRRQVQKH